MEAASNKSYQEACKAAKRKWDKCLLLEEQTPTKLALLEEQMP